MGEITAINTEILCDASKLERNEASCLRGTEADTPSLM